MCMQIAFKAPGCHTGTCFLRPSSAMSLKVAACCAAMRMRMELRFPGSGAQQHLPLKLTLYSMGHIQDSGQMSVLMPIWEKSPVLLEVNLLKSIKHDSAQDYGIQEEWVFSSAPVKFCAESVALQPGMGGLSPCQGTAQLRWRDVHSHSWAPPATQTLSASSPLCATRSGASNRTDVSRGIKSQEAAYLLPLYPPGQTQKYFWFVSSIGCTSHTRQPSNMSLGSCLPVVSEFP